jgi:hypothetical protein
MNEKSDTMEIYLLIGQSNMAGRGPIEEQDLDTLENVFLFTGIEGKEWEKAANPMNKYSTVRKSLAMQKLNPAYSFGREMAKTRKGKQIGLVVNAKGGTSIALWAPGEELYIEAVKQAKQAMEFGELKGIVWHQGESDASKTGKYLSKIETLIEALRLDLNCANVPFIAGQLSEDKPKRIDFNKMILNLPEVVRNTAVATSENLHTIDSTHFDAASQRLLGERYAVEMLKLLSKDK